MKKYTVLAVLLSFVMLLGACGGEQSQTPPLEEPEAKTMVNVVALKGPTGMSMVEIMDLAQKHESRNDYLFTVVGAPDEAVAMLTSGQADIIGVPTNLAATLYQKTNGNVQLLNINTLGVLYILERDGETLKSLEDLKGKTLYATGKGATPEYVINYLFTEQGLDPQKDLAIEYKSEHSELAALLAAGEIDYALLPQPFVTSVLQNNSAVRVALDITEIWEAVAGEENPLVMGATIVRKDFAENNPEAVVRFLEDLKSSTHFVNDSVEDAAALIGQFDIMPEPVAKQAIPQSNMVYIVGEEMKMAVETYLDILNQANPNSIGGQMPDDAFYFIQP